LISAYTTNFISWGIYPTPFIKQKTMKNLATLMLIGSLSTATFAQNNHELTATALQETSGRSLTGRVLDGVTQVPLEWCTVVLQLKGSSEQLSVSADEQGQFSFDNLQPGQYLLTVFYVGYDQVERDIEITHEPGEHNLGSLLLNGGATQLGEVTITDVRKLIDIRPDGLVYNADKDASSKGSTADELLRKVPMVTVDLEGNVQLRGSGNIKVLINGRPSTIVAASVKDALRQIPANNIKQVEVITSPGAKYDGEGAAGVINIITRKNLIQGISGTAYSSLNYRFEAEQFNGMAGTNLTFRQNKWGVNAVVGGGRWTNLFDGSSERKDFPETPQESTLTQGNRTFGYGNFYWGELSGDYQIDSLQSIQAGINFHPGKWTNEIKRSNIAPQLGLNFNQDVIEEGPRNTVGANAAYSKKFKNNPYRTLDVLAQYAVEGNNNDYTLEQPNNLTEITEYKERNLNKTSHKEFTGQIDYVQPLKNPTTKLETGLKYINRNVTSDYNLSTWHLGDADYTNDATRTNRLQYTQQVAAAYGQLSTPLSKKMNLVGGLRYEYTQIAGRLRDNGGAFSSAFHNLMPSAILSLDLKNYAKLKLSYNQRIERPSIAFINPFVNSADQLNIKYGNPQLEPELTHNIELGYSSMIGKTTMINLAAFYRNTGNAIESIATVGTDGVNRITFSNAATNDAYGLNGFVSSTLFSRWMISLNGNIYYKYMRSEALNINNDGIQFDFHLFSNVKLDSKWAVEGFGMYRGRQVMLQGKQTGWYYYTLGIKRSILKGKGDLTLVGENFLTPKVKIRTDQQYINAGLTGDFNAYARGIKLSFNYRFGKMNFGNNSEKAIKNDDLKNGGNSQGGQQGL
jgi:ferric enterobactin receptor